MKRKISRLVFEEVWSVLPVLTALGYKKTVVLRTLHYHGSLPKQH